MPNLDECKRPDGSYDWNKYNELQARELEERKAKGEICQRKNCRRWIMFSKGHPDTCTECKALDSPHEVRHSSDIRCPKCGAHWTVFDGEHYELCEEGEHDVSCVYCNHDFRVHTHVSYTIESPERLKVDPETTEET